MFEKRLDLAPHRGAWVSALRSRIPLTLATSRKRLPPRLLRAQAQIIAIDTQKVEGHERGLRPGGLGQERHEVAPPVLAQHTASISALS